METRRLLVLVLSALCCTACGALSSRGIGFSLDAGIHGIDAAQSSSTLHDRPPLPLSCLFSGCETQGGGNVK